MIDQQKQMAGAEQIVKAGMKLMYDKSTRQMLDQAMQSQQPIADVLAYNAVGVIRLLWDKSQKSLPPESIGPATAMLVYELASFMRDAGKEVTGKDVQAAIAKSMELLKQVFTKDFQPKPPVEAQGLIQQPMGA